MIALALAPIAAVIAGSYVLGVRSVRRGRAALEAVALRYGVGPLAARTLARSAYYEGVRPADLEARLRVELG